MRCRVHSTCKGHVYGYCGYERGLDLTGLGCRVEFTPRQGCWRRRKNSHQVLHPTYPRKSLCGKDLEKKKKKKRCRIEGPDVEMIEGRTELNTS